jgi:hypothetical protein
MEDNTSSNIETPNVQNTNISNTGGIKRWQVNTIIILGLLLLVTLGLLFYVIAFKKPSNNAFASLKITTKKTNTVVNPYKGWKTYTNPTYGYSFKYPTNWTINTSQAIPKTANNAPASPNTSTVTLAFNGYTFTFSYYITGIGGSVGLLSKIEPITIDNHNYDLVFHANTEISSCHLLGGSPGSINADPNNQPTACKEYTNTINVENIKYVLTGYYSDIFMQINNEASLIELMLPHSILTNTIDNNGEVITFKKIIKSIVLPK